MLHKLTDTTQLQDTLACPEAQEFRTDVSHSRSREMQIPFFPCASWAQPCWCQLCIGAIKGKHTISSALLVEFCFRNRWLIFSSLAMLSELWTARLKSVGEQSST